MVDTLELQAKLSQEYRNFLRKINLQRARVACILGAALVVASSLLDHFMHPEFFQTFLSVRVACAFFLTGVYAFSFTEFGKNRGLLIGMLVVLSIAIALGIIIRFLGYETPYYAGLNLIILAIGVLFPWRMKESVFACLAIYGMYLVPILIFDKLSNYRIFVNNNLFMVETIIIAIAANYFTSRLRFQEFMGRYKLNVAYEQLKELDKLKTQFFSNISHEFRTPLTLILAPTESMLQGSLGILPPQAKEEVKVIYNNSLRLLKLIDDLLDITKIDAEKMELDLEKDDIAELIRGILGSVENIAEKKKLKLYYTEKNKLPKFYFDRDKIEKVLLNLITNSLKFTEKGEIEISSEKADQQAVIKVRDTGAGIAEQDLPKMFNRFMQLDGSSTRRHEGTGLGLSLSRDLVKLHHGDIKIETKLGAGTTMIVDLPLSTKKVSLPKEADKEPVTKLPTRDDWLRDIHKKAQYVSQGVTEEKIKTKELLAVKETGKSRHRILVVEDNLDMLNFISLQLKDNYEVLGAKDGEEGLELAKKHLPDLVISDIMMPKMDGYGLLKALRNDYRLKNIPVIFLTAKAELDMKIEGLEYGAEDYLVKPFNSQELLARVKNLIMIRELHQELYSVAKMASVGQLAAGTAHEINNPLAAAMSELRVLKRELTKQDNAVDKKKLNELIALSYTPLERIEMIVKNLLSFSRKNREGVKFDDVHEGLDSTLSVLAHELKDKVNIHKQYCVDGKIECDMGKLNQVFMNVILNSAQSIKDKGNIWLTTELRGTNFVISIKDDGEGIAKEHLQKVFNPFFTTKDINQGVGLGLTVSYNLIKEHSGNISVKSETGKGTEVIITVPIKAKG